MDIWKLSCAVAFGGTPFDSSLPSADDEEEKWHRSVAGIVEQTWRLTGAVSD